MIFHMKNFDFFIFEKISEKKSNFFRDRKKTYFFSELKKKLRYSFDAEMSYLSIGDALKAIRTLLRWFWEPFVQKVQKAFFCTQ